MVVTVTYGARHELAATTIERSLAAGADRVLVVVNGGPAATRAALAAVADRHGRDAVHLLELDRNLGSAGGFHAGLAAAVQHEDMDYVWVLDDDNWPRPDALAEALRSLHGLEAGGAGRVAVVSYRDNLAPHQHVRRGTPPELVYARPGSAVNFDVRTRLLRRRVGPPSQEPPPDACVEVPMAPYGGLLLERAVLTELGLPRAELVLYEDDHEYTERLRQGGLKLFLCLASVVEDADGPLTMEDGAPRGIVRLLRTPEEHRTRLYYQVRNGIHVDRQRCRTVPAKVVFALNAGCYVLALVTFALMDTANRAALGTALHAIGDGLRGRLGMTVALT
jgi:GT2 family glycosyltransferase